MGTERLTLDREVTGRTFAKHGGAKDWLEACNAHRMDRVEAENYRVICTALTLANSQEDPDDTEGAILNYRETNDGLMFGLYVLSLNFMRKREEINLEQVLRALDSAARYSQAFLDRVLENPGPPFGGERPSWINSHADVEGFQELIDDNIDQLCPRLDGQDHFRDGARMAEEIFVRAAETQRFDEVVKSSFP